MPTDANTGKGQIPVDADAKVRDTETPMDLNAPGTENMVINKATVYIFSAPSTESPLKPVTKKKKRECNCCGASSDGSSDVLTAT